MSTLTRPQTRRRVAQRVVITAGLLGLTVALSVAALFGAAANPPCATPTPTPTGTGGAAAGTFAAPLQLQVGRAYEVGATEYGGPEDPTSGDFGSSGTYLPDHPDSFAELSLLDANPANSGGSLTFPDADALGALPYGTPVRVTHNGHALTLIKEDIGYGQGPGQPIPYRLDVWWQAAAQLQITKSTVEIQRLPATGSGALLNQLPAGTQANPAAAAACASGSGGSTPTPVTSGQVAQINPLTGIASAPAQAPAAVRTAIAAGNQLIDRPYVWGGGHADLDQLAAGYDCSGSAEYVLHHAGVFAPTTGPSSSAFKDHYPPGAGRWITVYANAEHMWLVVAGIVLDTAWYSTIAPTRPDSGPRWQPATVIQPQIAGNTVAGYPAFAVTHPNGF
jgi:hypothetical protein